MHPQRVPVLNPDGQPAMPAKASRVRRWLETGKAKVVHNDLKLFCVQLVVEPLGRDTQPIAVGIDPGKLYTGIAAQTTKATLFMAHLILPFQTVKARMEQRRMMRRNRRYRKCRRRPARFNNRRFKKVPPSIKANRQLELRVVKELLAIYPITSIVYEVVKANGSKSFSPVMVGQYWMLAQLEAMRPTCQKYGWETELIRTRLGLEKQKSHKRDAIPQTHAVDGIALAASVFIEYRQWHTTNAHGANWVGECQTTSAPFAVIRRPPISRRQLHLMVPTKGGVRRKYGGTTTRHGVRKGDFVKAEQAGRVSVGWVSGDTERQISVSDINWKRIAQFTAKKVQLIQRSTGLLVASEKQVVKSDPLEWSDLTPIPPHPAALRVGYPANLMTTSSRDVKRNIYRLITLNSK